MAITKKPPHVPGGPYFVEFVELLYDNLLSSTGPGAGDKHDIFMWGTTANRYLQWDMSADKLLTSGRVDVQFATTGGANGFLLDASTGDLIIKGGSFRATSTSEGIIVSNSTTTKKAILDTTGTGWKFISTL